MIGGIVIVAAWITCGLLVSLLYVTVWCPNAAHTETAHCDDPERTPSRGDVPVHLHQYP